MGHARRITEMLCRSFVLCLILLGILLIALNIALMLVSVVTGQILNPSFRMLLGMTLFGWIAAFALAGLVHVVSLALGRRLSAFADGRQPVRRTNRVRFT